MTAALWCRWCNEPVRRDGSDSLALAVHTGTGRERCAGGGHIAAPIDFLPAGR